MDKKREIIEKVRKLQAHAASAGELGNEAEAEAFNAKIQELMQAYKLHQSDVDGAGHVEEPIDRTFVTWQMLGLPVRSVKVPWTEVLGRLIAKAYYCVFVLISTPKHVRSSTGWIGYFAGAATDRSIAVQQYVILARFVERAATRSWNDAWNLYKRNGDDVRKLRGFRKDWIKGFLERLSERIEEELKIVSPEAPAGTTSEAIVLVRNNALARVDKWLADTQKLKMVNNPDLRDGNNELGYMVGRAAADKVNLGQKALTRPSAGRLRTRS